MINEIAEILHERAEKPLIEPDMPTLDDVVEAQEAMLISVPAELRDFLLNSSFEIYGRLEPVTVADRNCHTYLPEVAAEAWARGMPREYIPLCQDRSNIYCVSEEGTVYVWNESLDEQPEEVASNVWEWVRDVWLES
ncbi:SMI1/KNR4 family protein [Teredinibacter waterburyi]|uniref:SMI1/KNR4 family protein n=1 Tax=Teredinibacter waterburyi TaxID=1500538 RepID=UPI00165F0532|nr:SMI1/KNR4 family protein [Teredinibacter waterburyi]